MLKHRFPNLIFKEAFDGRLLPGAGAEGRRAGHRASARVQRADERRQPGRAGADRRAGARLGREGLVRDLAAPGGAGRGEGANGAPVRRWAGHRYTDSQGAASRVGDDRRRSGGIGMAISTYTLEQFIADMQELVDAQPDQQKLFDRGSVYLERLVTTPDAIPEQYPLSVRQRATSEPRQLRAASRAGPVRQLRGLGPWRSRRAARSPDLGHDRRAPATPFRRPATGASMIATARNTPAGEGSHHAGEAGRRQPAGARR